MSDICNCAERKCKYFDESMKLNCAYSENPYRCVKQKREKQKETKLTTKDAQIKRLKQERDAARRCGSCKKWSMFCKNNTCNTCRTNTCEHWTQMEGI